MIKVLVCVESIRHRPNAHFMHADSVAMLLMVTKLWTLV